MLFVVLFLEGNKIFVCMHMCGVCMCRWVEEGYRVYGFILPEINSVLLVS